MKIDFNQKIMNAKGDAPLRKIIVCEKCRKEIADMQVDYTLADAAVLALLAPEEKIDLKEKVRRGDLAMQISRSDEPVDFEIADIQLIQKRIGEVTSNLLIISQAYKMLEGTTENDNKS